jgi:hypothetical protein
VDHPIAGESVSAEIGFYQIDDPAVPAMGRRKPGSGIRRPRSSISAQKKNRLNRCSATCPEPISSSATSRASSTCSASNAPMRPQGPLSRAQTDREARPRVALIARTVTTGASQARASSCGTAGGEAGGPRHPLGRDRLRRGRPLFDLQTGLRERIGRKTESTHGVFLLGCVDGYSLSKKGPTPRVAGRP